MLDFVVAHDLVANVDAVQYTIRLLLPEGSLLLSAPQVSAGSQHYDTARLSWLWTAEEEGLDELQLELAALVEAAAADGVAGSAEDSFAAVDARVRAYSPAPWSALGSGRAATRQPLDGARRSAAEAQRAVVLLQRAHLDPTGGRGRQPGS